MHDETLYPAISEALRPYFDGLYDGDVEAMRRVFHPACRLYAAPGGELRQLDMDSYYDSVRNRPSPRALGQVRHDAILSIAASGEGAATAVLRTARAPRLYTDFLSLLRIDGRWQIVAKTYSWTTLPGAAAEG